MPAAQLLSLLRVLWLCRLVAVSSTGDGVKSGVYKKLTNLVGLDNRLDWPGLMPVLRTNAMLYKSEVRSDFVARHGLHTCSSTYL